MTHWFSAGAGALAAIALAPALTNGALAQSLAERATRGLVELETGTADGIGPNVAQDLSALIDDGATRRLVAVLGDGGSQNIVDLRALRGIDLALVTTDALDEMHAQNEQITYIAKLYTQDFQLLARPEVKTLDDLAGKKINVSGGQQIVAKLALKADVTHYPTTIALQKLAAGEISAAAFVGAKPELLLRNDAGKNGLHLLSVPLKAGMGEGYAPSHLSKDDYPGLVADQPVDTIAVGTVLAVANLQVGSDRYHNVVNFVDTFFTNFQTLLEPGHDPKWREVNLAADMPGFRRFAPAQQWLAHNAPVAAQQQQTPTDLRAMFERFLDERLQHAGAAAMSQQQKDQLFSQFVNWQSGAPH